MNVKMKVKRNVASVADTTATVSMLLSFSSVSVESNTTELHDCDQPSLDLEVLINLLLHSTSLGSGSHSPFPMHVDVFGPERISPGEQANVTLTPSTSRAG